MAILTKDQLDSLGMPPKPPVQTIEYVDPKTGKPSAALLDWLSRLDNWHRRLFKILGE